MRHLPVVILASCALVIVACRAGAPTTPDPGGTARALPTLGPHASAPTLLTPNTTATAPAQPAPDRPGRAVRPDSVTLSADKRVVTLDFIGAPIYEPTNPCAMEYAASAQVVGAVLKVEITERVPVAAVPLEPNWACPSIGFARSLDVKLPESFKGFEVHASSGHVFFVDDPDGLVVLPALPAEWKLVASETLPESPTGRWQRSYTNLDALPNRSMTPGRIDLIQSFGGPVYVTGGDELRTVEVNSRAAQLWRDAPSGELVLVWTLERNGLALVANESDFTIEELVALAESAELPGSEPQPTTAA